MPSDPSLKFSTRPVQPPQPEPHQIRPNLGPKASSRSKLSGPLAGGAQRHNGWQNPASSSPVQPPRSSRTPTTSLSVSKPHSKLQILARGSSRPRRPLVVAVAVRSDSSVSQGPTRQRSFPSLTSRSNHSSFPMSALLPPQAAIRARRIPTERLSTTLRPPLAVRNPIRPLSQPHQPRIGRGPKDKRIRQPTWERGKKRRLLL